ncbi:hypothetical protein SCARR_01025 [Pontiella sulfatireligans]|uniref:Fibronectin type-III domain-containing protein n=2 Tax=Pontiella sulfatireligans TaxID=2750658 RepID=A0A6C2UHT6_9BACT|nr:hypothetical protein SCARR_01025 [Pontiella sulfatireligans]
MLDANQAPYSSGDNVYSNLTQYIDWYPTLINMTGQPLYGTDLDGINLTSNLFSRTSARLGYEGCYFGLDDYWASTRNERWKLHFNRLVGDDHVLELYDLWTDIGEATNVASVFTSERDALIARQDQWFGSGDVTASFMPLTGDSLPPYTNPAPFGDILEITATQTESISNPNNGVSVGFSDPSFKSLNAYDIHIQASDVIEYDLYVAADSDQVSGFFCSPSRSSKPLFSTERGIHSSGSMLNLYSMPKGEWIRVAAGVGDIAPSTARPQYIGLFNSSPGTYHFYIDNVVIRRKDGTIRAMVWNNGNDSDPTPSYYYNRVKYNTLAEASAVAGFPFSDISLSTTDLSTLDVVDPGTGTNQVTVTPATGIGIDYPVWADNATDTTGNGSNNSTGNAQVGDVFGDDNVRRSIFAFDVDDTITPDKIESAVLKLYYRGANANAEATGGAVSLYHSEAADVWSGSPLSEQRDWFNLGGWTNTGLNVVATPTEDIGYKEIDVTAEILADLNNDPGRPAIDGGSNKVMSHFLIRWDNEGTFDADLTFDAVEGSVGDPILELNFKPVSSPASSESSYTEWITGIEGLNEIDPAGAGPTNAWPLILEYGLGSDPATYTAGFMRGTNAPMAQQLGSYAIQDNVLTMSFDFNRNAGDIEVVVSESTNLIDWADTLVLQPPYSDTALLSTNPMVLSISDNAATNGYSGETTRVTARSGNAVDDEPKGFLKLEVRPSIASAATPLYLNTVSHNGILLEWSGSEQELFIIERAAAGSGSFTQLAQTGNYQYTDTSAIAGQSYNYRVRAVNAAGVTEWSNLATAIR